MFFALDVTRALWFNWDRYLPGMIRSQKMFQSKLIVLLLILHSFPHGHEFMCRAPHPPHIHPTRILLPAPFSALLELPSLHLLEAFLQTHFSKVSVVENVETERVHGRNSQNDLE